MKKLILSLVLLISFAGVQAQKSNVNKAKSKATSETPDFAEARQLIAPALLDESTKNEANTWYVAGLIGYNESRDMDLKAYNSGTEVDVNKKGQIVMESYDYLIKADNLDQQPNDKGKVKPRFRNDIKNILKEYYAYNLIEYGAYLFDNRDFANAYNVFNTFVQIPDLAVIQNEIPKDSTYNMIKYYAALSATSADMSKEAITIYNQLKNENYEAIAVHQLLSEEYLKVKDTVNYEKTLAEGARLFPQEPWFIQKLINTYIDRGQNQEALDYLNTAIKNDPNSAEYRFVEGGLKETLNDIDGAIAAFKKATELDPTMGRAYAELGRIHYNKAIEIGDAADQLKDINKIKEEQAKALEEFKISLPYYEKAHELEPEEMNYKVLLRTLYYRLRMDKEYEAISKEIEG